MIRSLMCLTSAALAVLDAIEDDGLLAAIEPDEIGALAVHQTVIAAREVAFRPLDLDHARA